MVGVLYNCIHTPAIIKSQVSCTPTFTLVSMRLEMIKLYCKFIDVDDDDDEDGDECGNVCWQPLFGRNASQGFLKTYLNTIIEHDKIFKHIF